MRLFTHAEKKFPVIFPVIGKFGVHGMSGTLPLRQLAMIVERPEAQEAGGASQLLFDAQQLVVLGDTVRARCRSGLYLSDARTNSQVGDERVFRLAGAMADDRRVSVAPRKVDRLERLGDGSDLIH